MRTIEPDSCEWPCTVPEQVNQVRWQTSDDDLMTPHLSLITDVMHSVAEDANNRLTERSLPLTRCLLQRSLGVAKAVGLTVGCKFRSDHLL